MVCLLVGMIMGREVKKNIIKVLYDTENGPFGMKIEKNSEINYKNSMVQNNIGMKLFRSIVSYFIVKMK